MFKKRKYQSLEDVHDALLAPFEKNELKYKDGKPYIPHYQARKRLIEILGVYGFSIEYPIQELYAEPSSVPPIMWARTTCKLTLDFSEWGGEKRIVYGTDAKKLNRFSNKEKNIENGVVGQICDLGDDEKSAMARAFVKACESIGIGLYLCLNPNHQQTSNTTPPSNSNYNELWNIVNNYEKALKINIDDRKEILISSYPKQRDFKKLNEKQLEFYISIIKHSAEIAVMATNSNTEKLILNELSRCCNQQFNNFKTTIGFMNEAAVEYTGSYLKQSKSAI
ncbi:hypothetical protein CN931_28725 [Bacillus sp. AFS054943]|uniref:Uncharacterized protein n=1 Tax=Bacillus thuringiensis serovar sooncheon TaxID=180891 RepID=A0A9Q5SD67_BACTU|nr:MULTISPECIES: hypothetical protein [Bacillus]MEB9661226.1 hypothetical protein [Bacillus cereus]ARV91270.1 hypothetical protein BJG91_00950 [Bacillus thuringiensis]OTW65667.1 hypothetical protein BK707_28640 [Bacillus thuringiensis serovar coreanensis]OTX42533.1 hypothetical protein BK724_24460 [Bacillus thuringiensis serovar sooncheon]OTX54580.1 hypothetical protein BK725_12930 [Bacillus thuringiensis serovar guiyangiensis]